MRLQLTILTFLLVPTILLGQNLKTVEKYSFKNFDSFVFSKEHAYQFAWVIKDKADYFTPDSLDILASENEILKQIESFKSMKFIRKGLSTYDRQIIGYQNNNREKILILNFINTENGKKARELKKSIDKELIIGFGDWYEKNTFRLSYNLTTKKLEIW
jgi:hypothetical protein